MKKLLIFLLLIATSLVHLAMGQTPTPGGVPSSIINLWIKADGGVTTTGTASVSGWEDLLNSITVTQATTGSQPTLIANHTNFNPGVKFDGNDQLSIAGGILGNNITYNDISIIIVARTDTAGYGPTKYNTIICHDVVIPDPKNSISPMLIELPSSGNPTRGLWALNSRGAYVFLWGTFDTNYIWSFIMTSAITLYPIKYYRNGKKIFEPLYGTAYSTTSNGGDLSIGSRTTQQYPGIIDEFYNGAINEMIMLKESPTTLQVERIESYLAIKYGITLEHNYVASNGTTITWNRATNVGYNNDIAGIGRDDDSAIEQKQSASINTRNILTIGNGDIFTTNSINGNSFTADKSFFIWGHNGRVLGKEPNQGSFTSVKGGHRILSWFSRIWQAQETGTVGSLKLRFDMSTIKDANTPPNIGVNDLANVRLLVDSDGVFDAATTTTVAPTVYNNTTDIVDFDFDFTAYHRFLFYYRNNEYNRHSTTCRVSEVYRYRTKPTGGGVLLKWTTATEENNDYFEIESSVDAKTWKSVAKVKGQGTTSTQTSYEHTDDKPYVGTSYYRLKQVDFDGKWTYSDMVPIDIYNAIQLSVAPNPSNGSHTVKVSLNTMSNKGTHLFDTSHSKLNGYRVIQ